MHAAFFFLVIDLKSHKPVGSCAEANLVSKIPAPSIKANRMPPMAAEPNMATGPSEEERGILWRKSRVD